MALSYRDPTRNARLDRLTADLGATAFLEIFTGAPAGKTAGVYNADPGTKLASLACSNPVAPPSAGAVLTFGTIAAAAALASGTPASFRFKSAASGAPATVIIEGVAGVGSGDLSFASAIVIGGTVSLPSAAITEANQ